MALLVLPLEYLATTVGAGPPADQETPGPPNRDPDSRSRPNRESAGSLLLYPAKSGIGDSDSLPGLPAKSGIGGTGIGEFRVRAPPWPWPACPPAGRANLKLSGCGLRPSQPSALAALAPLSRRGPGLLQLAMQGALSRAPLPLPLPLPQPQPQPLLGRERGLALVCTAPVRARSALGCSGLFRRRALFSVW
jgi:hypothetical protein